MCVSLYVLRIVGESPCLRANPREKIKSVTKIVPSHALLCVRPHCQIKIYESSIHAACIGIDDALFLLASLSYRFSLITANSSFICCSAVQTRSHGRFLQEIKWHKQHLEIVFFASVFCSSSGMLRTTSAFEWLKRS